MDKTFLPYIITEIYCMVFSIILLFRLNGNMASEHEIRELKYMVISYIVLMFSDIFYVAAHHGAFPISNLTSAVANAIGLVAVVLGCYFWFKFIEDRLQPFYIKIKHIGFIAGIPITIMCILDVVSIFTGWVFYIDNTGAYSYGPLFNLQGIVSYAYLLIPTVTAVVMIFKTHSKQLKKEYLAYSLYMVVPLTSTIYEDKLYTVPIFALNIFLVVYFLFLMIQDMQINSDALTDLNNRRRLNEYLEDRIRETSETRPLVLFMTDLNDFKEINDTFGHLEGDEALKFFAGVLKQVAMKFNAFLARYGGDEFCLVADYTLFSPEIIESHIHEALKNALADRNADSSKYGLSVSIGYAVCEDPTTEPDALIRKADIVLYTKKKEWHLQKSS